MSSESEPAVASDADEVERHPCPRCAVAPGSPCRSRSGAVATTYHTGRSPRWRDWPSCCGCPFPPTVHRGSRGGRARRPRLPGIRAAARRMGPRHRRPATLP
ncbi:zinc finger domain-containing protein [Saccharothrix sp. NRRL B-16314]|uniref:zinc finger domain-containing protein n=1 Tax=Saccharothrix sp. NRRL B-16314 TaxID=1463825 RepID=UPI003FA7A9C2